MFKQAVVVLSLLCVAFAAVAVEEIPNKLGEKEGCHDHDKGELVPFGTWVTSTTGCAEFQCERDGSWRGLGCPSVAAMPPCYVEEDPSRPFPDCCPTARCPGDN
ncbi:U-scoloptoxin(16)-Er12a [Bicyclus anynana]|uniref:U-scoloptoxin(16)-Er12a n=1 Tax=Bicyclus anynana TaxID=110368 RepID=A0A6J1P5R1_BICAN|nr:U-scoloptoxin(16)-Er12a [Bicyclus anynana]